MKALSLRWPQLHEMIPSPRHKKLKRALAKSCPRFSAAPSASPRRDLSPPADHIACFSHSPCLRDCSKQASRSQTALLQAVMPHPCLDFFLSLFCSQEVEEHDSTMCCQSWKCRHEAVLIVFPQVTTEPVCLLFRIYWHLSIYLNLDAFFSTLSACGWLKATKPPNQGNGAKSKNGLGMVCVAASLKGLRLEPCRQAEQNPLSVDMGSCYIQYSLGVKIHIFFPLLPACSR